MVDVKHRLNTSHQQALTGLLLHTTISVANDTVALGKRRPFSLIACISVMVRIDRNVNRSLARANGQTGQQQQQQHIHINEDRICSFSSESIIQFAMHIPLSPWTRRRRFLILSGRSLSL